ncbi:undecaprenyl-diphosphatase [Amycolatopsis sulphurea]|uniref:Undecaprenyl-diphosphatase n=1 Tax=Amycolatopsis sulphurea TaxID=76022 RepID=A0A2A9FF43_9PSEU|nr:phosphatase PAP2 family protein [Amycolatopsis sulphurea]PFG49361.1 undecaprenyl-diphosphatase [Amycolatopsis sulphurea]
MIDAGIYRNVTDFAWAQHWLSGLGIAVAEYGVFLVVPVILALLWRARHHGADMLAVAVWVPLSMALAFVADTALKSLFAEVRPCRVVAGVHTLLPCDPPADYAFPSNHTVLVAAFAAAMFLVNRRWGRWAAVFAVVIGISRVYVGAHYPHDVLAGLVVGGVIGLLGTFARAPLAKLLERTVPALVRG